MSAFVFTPASGEHADPEAINAYQARLAKLKPACTQCGRVLTKKELPTRRCAETEDCRLRAIFHETPRHAYERAWGPYGRVLRKPLALAEIKARREFLARKAAPQAEGLPVLPPACLRCNKKLTAAELVAGRECASRSACNKRKILSFRAPNFLAERYAEAWARERTVNEREEAIAA